MEMEEKTKTKMVRVHRVGSVTAGLCMVMFGVMLLLQSAFHLVTYELILSLWPVILICLGVELLLSNVLTRRIIYDKGAICLMILMTLFAVGMAITDVCLKASEAYLYNYNM